MTLALARGLYAIVDVTSLGVRGLDPVAFARAVLLARPAALQIRAKDATPAALLELLRAVAPACRDADVPLVANDFPEIAALAGCDWVHVGQEDVPVADARRLAPGLRVGVSTHTSAQLEDALRARPDYIAYGPVFPTTSKQNADPCVGLDGLAHASALARNAGIPLVAIGGVTLSRAADLARWATASAAIQAILPQDAAGSPYDTVTAQTALLHAALGGETA